MSYTFCLPSYQSLSLTSLSFKTIAFTILHRFVLKNITVLHCHMCVADLGQQEHLTCWLFTYTLTDNTRFAQVYIKMSCDKLPPTASTFALMTGWCTSQMKAYIRLDCCSREQLGDEELQRQKMMNGENSGGRRGKCSIWIMGPIGKPSTAI